MLGTMFVPCWVSGTMPVPCFHIIPRSVSCSGTAEMTKCKLHCIQVNRNRDEDDDDEDDDGDDGEQESG